MRDMSQKIQSIRFFFGGNHLAITKNFLKFFSFENFGFFQKTWYNKEIITILQRETFGFAASMNFESGFLVG